MAESAKHILLINLMKSIIIDKENIDSALIFVDDPIDRTNCPPIINGYRPDLYYDFNGRLIIGEAKTKNDLLNSHTNNQLETYIKLCSNFKGYSCFYLSVPWTESALAKNIIKKLIKKLGVSINYYVIDELQKI